MVDSNDRQGSQDPADKDTVRIGEFSRLGAADRAVALLHESGFQKDEITVVCDACKHEDAGAFKSKAPSGASTPSAAAEGSAIGAVLGGLVAVAGAVATGGSLLVAGPSFTGAGAVAGGLIGAMMTRGKEDESTDYFDQAMQHGKILVSVDLSKETDSVRQDERLATAERILRQVGSEPVPLHKG
jgi:hypothetical protein